MFAGFRNFILRGNVLDLAVGVIIGAAFSAVVNSLSADVITPLIGLLFGEPDFSKIVIAGTINLGNLLNAIINLLITAFALYFFVVAPVNALNNRLHPKAAEPSAPTRACPECLTIIPAAARRCAACTAALEPVAPPTAG